MLNSVSARQYKLTFMLGVILLLLLTYYTVIRSFSMSFEVFPLPDEVFIWEIELTISFSFCQFLLDPALRITMLEYDIWHDNFENVRNGLCLGNNL